MVIVANISDPELEQPRKECATRTDPVRHGNIQSSGNETNVIAGVNMYHMWRRKLDSDENLRQKDRISRNVGLPSDVTNQLD